MRRFGWRDERGQMTIELCIFLPIAIIIGTIVVNSLMFLGSCSEFDRIARNAIRIHGVSLSYGQTVNDSTDAILARIEENIDDENIECTVSVTSDFQGFATYVAKARFMPNLFGMGLRTEIFGIPLPPLEHSTQLTVFPYKPGILF